MRALEDIVDKVKIDGTSLILSGITPQLQKFLCNGLRQKLEHVGLFPDIEAALNEASYSVTISGSAALLKRKKNIICPATSANFG